MHCGTAEPRVAVAEEHLEDERRARDLPPSEAARRGDPHDRIVAVEDDQRRRVPRLLPADDPEGFPDRAAKAWLLAWDHPTHVADRHLVQGEGRVSASSRRAKFSTVFEILSPTAARIRAACH